MKILQRLIHSLRMFGGHEWDWSYEEPNESVGRSGVYFVGLCSCGASMITWYWKTPYWHEQRPWWISDKNSAKNSGWYEEKTSVRLRQELARLKCEQVQARKA